MELKYRNCGHSCSACKRKNLVFPLFEIWRTLESVDEKWRKKIIREIAKEVYLKAGHEFEFVEGDKSKQHESVQAYKKAVEDAKEKASQIIHESLKVAESVENEAKKSKWACIFRV